MHGLRRSEFSALSSVKYGLKTDGENMSKFDEKRKRRRRLRLHPLFIAVGVWYCFTGELFLFLLGCLVALQHECAHAFAAARLGYKLNQIVLMPYGAVIDGDLRGITLRDEIAVAVSGPLCNLITAGFFGALWWFFPATYPFTDTAFYSSLSIALINLLPAYPLDGGRVLRCLLVRAFSKREARRAEAERKARRLCTLLAIAFALGFFLAFVWTKNITLCAFGVFLLVGAIGNRRETASYERMDFSVRHALKKGVEIRRVAVLATLPIKDALKFVARDSYLVLEAYDEKETHLFDLPQNELSALFLRAESPLQTLAELKNDTVSHKK